MKTLKLQTSQQAGQLVTSHPVTPRGRAVYTLDWFLNGQPTLPNPDNQTLYVRGGFSC